MRMKRTRLAGSWRLLPQAGLTSLVPILPRCVAGVARSLHLGGGGRGRAGRLFRGSSRFRFGFGLLRGGLFGLGSFPALRGRCALGGGSLVDRRPRLVLLQRLLLRLGRLAGAVLE